MTHLRTASFCIVTAIALTALSVAAASADVPIKGTSMTGDILTQGGHQVECEKDTFNGTMTPDNKVTIKEIDGGNGTCRVFGEVCTSPGATSGTITISNLFGTLGFIVGSKALVGVALEPTKGALFSEFVCAPKGSETGEKFKVTGGITGVLTPLNTLTSKLTLTFTQSKGVEQWHEIEGGPSETLFTIIGKGTKEETGLSTVENILTGAPVEISTAGGKPHIVEG